MTIATRAAAAKPEDTAGLLDELWLQMKGATYVSDKVARHLDLDNFANFLAINTPESLLAAAMMLVPDGWLIAHLSELGAAGGCVCKLGNPETGDDTIADAGERTMALALIAAIAESKGV